MKSLLSLLALAGLIFGLVNFGVIVAGRGEIGVPFLISHMLAMVSFAYLLFAQIFPRLIFRASTEQLAQTARLVRASGEPLATMRTGGRIGWIEFRGPLLRATVYPAGIVIEPLLLATFGVPDYEIIDIGFTGGWRSLGGKRLEIHHRARHVAKPILLWCAENHPLVTALRTIASATAAHEPVNDVSTAQFQQRRR